MHPCHAILSLDPGVCESGLRNESFLSLISPELGAASLVDVFNPVHRGRKHGVLRAIGRVSGTVPVLPVRY
jgi:hypothetical protein